MLDRSRYVADVSYPELCIDLLLRLQTLEALEINMQLADGTSAKARVRIQNLG